MSLLVIDNDYQNKQIIKSLYIPMVFLAAISISFNILNPILAQEGELIKTAYLNPPQNIVTTQIDKAALLEKQKKEWDESVRQRYRNSRILTVTQGVKHMQMVKYINSRPVKINVVEVNRQLNSNIKMMPEMASSFSLAGKKTIKTIAQKNNSIAAVNCTYFKPQTGVPLGMLMKDGEILTGPIYNRVAMGISEDGFKMSRMEIDGKVYSKNISIKLDNINQPRMLATYVIAYTHQWGKMAPVVPKYGIQIAIENGKVTNYSTQPIEIPENGYVISGPAKILEEIINEKNIKVEIKTIPDWEDVNQIVSGGPYLLKDGEIYIDTKEEKLTAITGKNPRTAIGYTEDGNLILITIDGREESSVGMTLGELAWFLKSIGAYEAMNLDGGGSSVMYVNGNVVNAPAQKGGIAISNAFVINIEKDEEISQK